MNYFVLMVSNSHSASYCRALMRIFPCISVMGEDPVDFGTRRRVHYTVLAFSLSPIVNLHIK